MVCSRSAYAGFRFPSSVIMVAVRWYLRNGLSYRDVEELLAERGIEVDHVTVYAAVLDELIPSAWVAHDEVWGLRAFGSALSQPVQWISSPDGQDLP